MYKTEPNVVFSKRIWPYCFWLVWGCAVTVGTSLCVSGPNRVYFFCLQLRTSFYVEKGQRFWPDQASDYEFWTMRGETTIRPLSPVHYMFHVVHLTMWVLASMVKPLVCGWRHTALQWILSVSNHKVCPHPLLCMAPAAGVWVLLRHHDHCS